MARNTRFTDALERYRGYLKDDARQSVLGCTFEQFIDCLDGGPEIMAWKEFLNLKARYLVGGCDHVLS